MSMEEKKGKLQHYREADGEQSTSYNHHQTMDLKKRGSKYLSS